MLVTSRLGVGFLSLAWFVIAIPVHAASRLEPLTVGYSNITATYGPLWLAVEEHIGVKHGLDLKAIYAGRVRPQQLLATGEGDNDLAYRRDQRSSAGGDDHE
jgi:hypothetical protein